MRDLFSATARMAFVAGAALLVAACGGGTDEEAGANNVAADELDSNLMLEAPANDASALETTMNVPEPEPTLNTGTTGTDASDVLGNTSGGDTGGNTVESNVTGM